MTAAGTQRLLHLSITEAKCTLMKHTVINYDEFAAKIAIKPTNNPSPPHTL
jgi:hypothetical protein